MSKKKPPTRLHLTSGADLGMQACVNAVVRGLHHQKWVSDGNAWAPDHGPNAEAVLAGERPAMYSPMGWLVKEGRHRRVFYGEWGDYAVMQNSHRDMYPWFWGLTWQAREEVQRMLRRMRYAYSYHEGRPQGLHTEMRELVAHHKMKWPADVPEEYEET